MKPHLVSKLYVTLLVNTRPKHVNQQLVEQTVIKKK